MNLGFLYAGPVATPAVPLEYRATLTPDLSKANFFQVTLGGALTIANPVNVAQDGTPLLLCLIQDNAGNRLLTLGSQFTLGATVTSYTLSTTGNLRDYIGCIWRAQFSKWEILSVALGYA